MRKVWLLLGALLIAGCVTGNIRAEKFDAAARAYERALRWSDFRSALAVAGNVEAPLPDPVRLQSIRVTAYDIISAPRSNAENSKVVQVVEIRYVNTGNMSERVLMDQQIWAYSEKDERWTLITPFPNFR